MLVRTTSVMAHPAHTCTRACCRRLCESGWGAIHLAVRLGYESCVLALLQQDDSLKQQEDGSGFTPLATAAEVRPRAGAALPARAEALEAAG